MARAKANGKRLGRQPHRITDDDLVRVAHLSQHQAAAALGVPRSVLQRARSARKGRESDTTFAQDSAVPTDRDAVAL